jgi:hypothetical protein
MLWVILKQAVAHIGPKTIDELQCVLADVWDNMSQRVIDRLCQSFERWLLCCQDMQGGSIGHLIGRTGEEDAAEEYDPDQSPRRSTRDWTQEEETRLYSLVRAGGTLWAKYAKVFIERTPGALKCRWHSHLGPQEARVVDMSMDSALRLRELAAKNARGIPLTEQEAEEIDGLLERSIATEENE